MKPKTSRGVSALCLLVAMALGACAVRDEPPKSPEAATAAGADSAAPALEAKRADAPAHPPPPPKEEPKEEPMRVESDDADPSRALADAEALLDATLTKRKKTGRVGNDGSPPPAKEEAAAESCSVACRALASMRRSADRLCQLAPSASPDAPRCDDAKDRVTKAEQRVREQCPSCAASP